MDYKRIYDEFIADRRAKEAALIASGEYVERHHVVPRSLGGSDEKSNMIALTAADHYFAHECLARIHGGKMWAALYFMSQSGTTSAREVFVCRWKYDVARKKYADNMPEHIVNCGARLVDNEKRLKALAAYHATADISAMVKSRYKNPEYYNSWREAQKNAWTDERKQAKREKTKELWKTPEYKAKMVARKGAWTGKEAELSEAMKAKWKDPVFASKMKGRKQSVATQFQGKKTINLDTGEVFDSSLKAANAYGVSGTAIRNAIAFKGKSGGYRWAYAS